MRLHGLRGGAAAAINRRSGQVAEWLKAHAWNACIGASLSRVRIPLCPPALHTSSDCLFFEFLGLNDQALSTRLQVCLHRYAALLGCRRKQEAPRSKEQGDPIESRTCFSAGQGSPPWRALMVPVRFFHLSRSILPAGTVIEPRGYPFVSLKAEEILSAARPADCIPRENSVYLSESAERKKLGVKYDGGHLHVVEVTTPTKRHDLAWTGELQRRHPPTIRPTPKPGSLDEKIAASMKPNAALASLSDQEIANNYWLGVPSPSPHWEIATTSAVVIGLAET